MNTLVTKHLFEKMLPLLSELLMASSYEIDHEAFLGRFSISSTASSPPILLRVAAENDQVFLLVILSLGLVWFFTRDNWGWPRRPFGPWRNGPCNGCSGCSMNNRCSSCNRW